MPGLVKRVWQFVVFIVYYRRFIQNFTRLSEPLVALTRKGVTFAWTGEQQAAFDTLKACLLQAPMLGFPTEEGRFILDTDASIRLSQCRYCTTRREMLVAVAMCTHFRSYLRGAQFTMRTDHRLLRWLQKFRNSDGMLARWYILLSQFSVTFEYRPGAPHDNADGLSRQCGQCLWPDCPVSSSKKNAVDSGSPSVLMHQPFASSAMGDSMDADLLPELSGETWVAATYLDEVTADLPPAASEPDLIIASRLDETLILVRKWVQSG